MRNLLLPLLFILFSMSSWGKSRVTTENLPPELRRELVEKFQLQENFEYSFQEIEAMMKWIHQRSNLDLVQIVRDTQGEVGFKIIPTTRIKSVSLKGEESFSAAEILAFFNIKAGDALDSDQVLDNGVKLQKFYQENGFNNAEVEISFPSTEPHQIDVIIEVRENQRTLLKGLKVLSEHPELNQKLEKELRSKLGSVFSENLQVEIQKVIRDYLTENQYYRAEITGPEILFNATGSEAYLSFKLEKTTRSTVIIHGAKNFSVGYLEDIIGLDNFYSSNPNIANEMGNRIKTFYLSRGYARVEVQAQELPGKDLVNTKIQIDIEEGPQVRISQIVFSGRLSRPSEDYAKLLRKDAPELIQDGFYSKADFETSLNTLKVNLQNQGFLLAKPISTRTQYNKTKDQLSIFVNLDEGPLTQLTQVNFVGQKSFTADILLAELKLVIGGPLQLNVLQAAIQKLKTFYHERGYLEMVLLNENQEDLVKYDETNTKAQVQFNIFEGPKVEVASILVEGNSFTQEKIILLELEFGLNDVLTPSKIEESISRLQRTGYFSSVEIKTLEEKTNIAERTVQVRVTERDPGLFTIGVGATNEREFTLRGFTGVAYNNIFGTGRSLSVRVEGNYNVGQIRFLETKGTIGYLEPYLFDTRVRFRSNASLQKTLSDLNTKIGTDLNQYTFSLEKDFTSHVTGFFDLYNLAQSRDFNIENNNEIKRSDIASIGPAVDLDYRDNLFNPTKGTFTRLTFEYASPQLGSSRTIEYYRTTGSFTHYYPFRPKWVWANSFRAGYIENLYRSNDPSCTDCGIPYDKKGFILGGRSTLRGFDIGTNEVLPSVTDLGVDKDTPYYLTSSAIMSLIKTEVRFPIAGDFGGSVFYDGGLVKISGLDIPDNYRDAVGFGLRYVTPVGPVNIEVGQKLDRRANEDIYRLHFSIGSF